MVRPLTTLMAVAIGLAACALPPAPTTNESFHSNALGRTMRYRVFVPDTLSEARVVYLLHGHGGDEADWFTYSSVAEVARRHNLMIVTPDGDNSWYVNSPAGQWEDYIVTDLIREVERRWPVVKARSGRAVAGLSMGGYGAVRLALRHPEVFAFAASMSGALDITRVKNVFDPQGDAPNELRIFGVAGNETRRDNDVYRMAARADLTMLPYLYLDCGEDDPWFGINREFAALLQARQIAHEFHERQGDHNWAYWDRQVKVVLALADQRLR